MSNLADKFWIINTDDGDVFITGGQQDPLTDSYVKEELSYLDGCYDDERDQFIADIEQMKRTGRGSASIEERFTITIDSLRG